MFKLRYPLIALASALFGAVAAIGVYMYYVPLPKDAMARGEALAGTGADRAWLHGSMSEVFPTRTVRAAPDAAPWPARPGRLEGFTFTHEGRTRTLGDLHDSQAMLGLVIIRDGAIVHESYAPGYGAGTLFTTWSAVKSFTSTLVGRAIEQGLIASVEDPLDGYLPDLRGTAYAGVTIRQALEMSSGVAFDRDSIADTTAFLRDGPVTARAPAFDLAIGHERAAEPGTVFNYNTAETQVLLELVRRVTGQTAADYMSEALWQPLGMRYNAAWIIDAPGADGVEIGGALFNAALRDWARLGWLMAEDGVWQGKRLLPDDWVRAATTPGAPHLMPGEVHPDPELGYGWQWWTRGDGTFQASGAYGQMILVDPANRLVVAKASAWDAPRDAGHAAETLAMTRALAAWDFGPAGEEPEAEEGTESVADAPPAAPTGSDAAPDAESGEPGTAAAPAGTAPVVPASEAAPEALPAPSVKPDIDTTRLSRDPETSETPARRAAPPSRPPEQAPGEGMGVAESRFVDPEEIED